MEIAVQRFSGDQATLAAAWASGMACNHGHSTQPDEYERIRITGNAVGYLCAQQPIDEGYGE